ncbi:MAG TPA: hypothetical protein VLL98_06020 [Rickettsiales bacterium]|nr:hypothetical protein [Rickettsiales bacterium]
MKIIGCLVWIKRDWQKSKFLFIIESIFFVLNIYTSIYVAVVMPNINFLFLYITYIIATILGVFYSVIRNSFPLLLTNVCYLLIEIFATIRLL